MDEHHLCPCTGLRSILHLFVGLLSLMTMTHADLPLHSQLYARDMVLQALATSSLVTLAGPAGAGKSALAQGAREVWQAQHPELRILSFELRGIREPGVWLRSLHDALGLSPPDPRRTALDPLGAQVVEALGHSETLLLLDNADGLLDALPGLLGPLAELARVGVLVTACAPVQLAHEHLCQVYPLDEHESVLFLKHFLAPLEEKSLWEDEDRRAELLDLLRHVETTPFVLKMIASRLRFSAPLEIGRTLTELLGLSPSVSEGAQSSLGLTLWLNVQGLSVAQRQVANLCSFFQKALSAGAIEQLGRELGLDSASTFEALEGLHRRSLIYTRRREDTVEVHVYPSVRLFLLARLTSDQQATLTRVHRAFFLQRIHQEPFTHSLQFSLWTQHWLSDLRQVLSRRDQTCHKDLVRAFLILKPHLLHLVPTSDLAALVEVLLAQESDPALKSRLLCFKATLLQREARGEEAQEVLERAAVLLSSNPDEWAEAEVLLSRAQLAHLRSNQTLGKTWVEKLLEKVDPHHHPFIHLETLIYNAFLEYADHDTLRENMLPLLDKSRAIHDVYAEIYVCYNLATALVHLNHDSEASHYYRVMCDLARHVKDTHNQSRALVGLRGIETRHGRIEHAVELTLEAISLVRPSHSPAQLQRLLNQYGLILISQGNYAEAHRILEQNQSSLRRFPNDYIHVINQGNLGILSHLQGDFPLAQERYRTALRLSAEHHYPYWPKPMGNFYLALSLLQCHQFDLAIDSLKQGAQSEEQLPFFDLCVLLHSALVEPDRPLKDRICAHPPVIAQAGEMIEAIRARTPEVPEPKAPCWFCLRLLWQIWKITTEESSSTGALLAPSPHLQIHREGRFFVTLDATHVDMSRRGPMRKLLVALSQNHRHNLPPLSLDDLFAIGWPTEDHVEREIAHKRVYAAIGTLRRLGLEGELLTTDEGYQLDPHLQIERVPPEG